MNDYGKSLKRMSYEDLIRQRNLWELRSRENRWFYSLPMHQAVNAEIERREKNARRAA